MEKNALSYGIAKINLASNVELPYFLYWYLKLTNWQIKGFLWYKKNYCILLKKAFLDK